MKDRDAIASLLRPAFEVHFTRDAWTVEPAPGARLEVAFALGNVEARKREAPISEVEIECLEGDPGRAFDLATRLMQEIGLHPSAVSKAQRGYRRWRAGSARSP